MSTTERTAETFGQPADPIITEDALWDLCDYSNPDAPVVLDQDVLGYRAAAEQVHFETYVLALAGAFDGFPVQVTGIPATPAWITFGPADPVTGELPDERNGVRHDSLTEACAWAVRELNTPQLRWQRAVDGIRSHFPWVTHVSLTEDPGDSLGLIRVHLDNDTQGCAWECGDETSGFSQQGGEWSLDELMTSAYWAGLDPVASGWTVSTDPEFGRLWLVDLSAPVATAPRPA